MPENLAQERAALRAEWQRKTIKDDPIFGTVMTNPTLCAELLRWVFFTLLYQRLQENRDRSMTFFYYMYMYVIKKTTIIFNATAIYMLIMREFPPIFYLWQIAINNLNKFNDAD